MRRFFLILLLVILALGAYWVWQHNSDFRTLFDDNAPNQEKVISLRANLTADEIIDSNHLQLATQGGQEKEPELFYAPYASLNVTYTEDDGQARKGQLIWSLLDGEAVISTHPWSTTKGLGECLDVSACSEDFQIIRALSRLGGEASYEELNEILPVNRHLLQGWLQEAKKKHIIAQRGKTYYLQLQNPEIDITPRTKTNLKLTKKNAPHAAKKEKRYTVQEVIRMTHAAFGEGVRIEDSELVYIPIYQIELRGENNQPQISMWNGLTGEALN